MPTLPLLVAVLAEPDADSREMYTENLGAAGIRLVAVPTVDQAHAAVLFYSPHVVVTEIAMRHSDGFELLRRMKGDERTAHVPVIALTTCAFEHERKLIKREGFISLVPKPCDPSDLAVEIRRVVHLARLIGGAADSGHSASGS